MFVAPPEVALCSASGLFLTEVKNSCLQTAQKRSGQTESQKAVQHSACAQLKIPKKQKTLKKGQTKQINNST